MSQSDFETKCGNARFILEDFQRILTQYRWLASEEVLEANGTAILALEKQIPQKVKYRFVDVSEDSDFMGWDEYSCPSCGNVLSKCAYAKYCYRCGQRLDWEGVK